MSDSGVRIQICRRLHPWILAKVSNRCRAVHVDMPDIQIADYIRRPESWDKYVYDDVNKTRYTFNEITSHRLFSAPVNY
jgi:hypothetical protein